METLRHPRCDSISTSGKAIDVNFSAHAFTEHDRAAPCVGAHAVCAPDFRNRRQLGKPFGAFGTTSPLDTRIIGGVEPLAESTLHSPFEAPEEDFVGYKGCEQGQDDKSHEADLRRQEVTH